MTVGNLATLVNHATVIDRRYKERLQGKLFPSRNPRPEQSRATVAIYQVTRTCAPFTFPKIVSTDIAPYRESRHTIGFPVRIP